MVMILLNDIQDLKSSHMRTVTKTGVLVRVKEMLALHMSLEHFGSPGERVARKHQIKSAVK